MKNHAMWGAAIWIGLVSVFACGQGPVVGQPALSLGKSVKRQAPVGGLASLPQEAQSSISAALGRDLPAYQVRVHVGALAAENAPHKLAVDFTRRGVALRSGTAQWGLALRGYGYGNALNVVGTTVPRASSNRVEYGRGSLTEWYVNGPLGLEQGFTINKPPNRAGDHNSGVATAGGQPLTLALALSGNSAAAVDQSHTSLTLTDREGQAALRYTGLTAYDSADTPLRAWLEVYGEQLLLKVNDAQARYPVVIDPWVQLAELTASDGAADDSLGYSAAISGNTVVLGTPQANNNDGAAYVFVKPARGWKTMTQTAKLSPSDQAYHYGNSVAVNGNTVVVGAPWTEINGHPSEGSAYVFVKPARGWRDMKATAELTSNTSSDYIYFGTSVTAGGNTVVVSAGGAGLAYVFLKPAKGWKSVPPTAELSGGLGFGVALSMSGNTVVAGANGCCVEGQVYPGEADVFVEPSTGWANMSPTAVLNGSDETADDSFGASVGISGNTVVVGSPYNDNSKGAAYVFVKPSGGWANMDETAKLTASDGESDDLFGTSVAISGNTAVSGAYFYDRGSGHEGAVYVYVKPASGWKTTSNSNAELTVSGSAYLGYAVSISGNNLLAGAPDTNVGSNSGQGAAYVFGKAQ